MGEADLNSNLMHAQMKDHLGAVKGAWGRGLVDPRGQERNLEKA